MYDYFTTDEVNGKIRKYVSSWTVCLRPIRNIVQHWYDRPRPQQEPSYKIGDHKAYFLKTFPNLSFRVHTAVKSNDKLKTNAEFKNFFNFNESKPYKRII